MMWPISLTNPLCLGIPNFCVNPVFICAISFNSMKYSIQNNYMPHSETSELDAYRLN